MQCLSGKTDDQLKKISKTNQENGSAQKGRMKFWASTRNGMKSRRILIVDDDKKLLNLLSTMITMMGFEVTSTESGNEALNHFKKKPFDLVLTDLNMPGMDGWGLARHIKSLSPDTPVVLTTAEARKCVFEKIENSAIDLVLFKPFGIREFQKMVQKVFYIT
jgi:CheY-like chemotaxis protein